MPPTKQEKQVSNPQRSPPTTNDSLVEGLGNLIESKFASLEERIASLECKTTRQHEEVIGMIKVAEKTANSTLDLATPNSALITENTEKLTSHEFDHRSVLEILVSLETENRKMKEGLEETKNRSMRKTLIFKDQPQEQKRETWEQTKVTLAKETKKKMQNMEHDFITEKIERAHSVKDNKSGNKLPIIAKFTDRNFSEEIKSSFITAAKNGNDQIPIIVSQMYATTLIMQRKEVMKKRKELEEEDQRIQAYVKYPAILRESNQLKLHTQHMKSIRLN